MASNTVEGALREEAMTVDPLLSLVEGCRRREAAAQSELIRQTQDRVFGTVFRFVGPQDAEDVTQQVFLQVFRKIDAFSGESAFGTWLYRVTVNEALQFLRDRRGPRSEALKNEPLDHGPRCEKQVEEKELLDRVLLEIDPELRVLFLLREVDGLSYEQIAKTLNIPMGTVASRLSRARDELQDRLCRLGWNA